MSVVLTFAANFGSTIILARILSPRDFGIVAMAGAVATIINVLMQFGLAKYVTREARLTREDLRSVFTVNVIMSMIYVAAILGAAFTAGWLFSAYEIARFLTVFGVFPLFAMMEFVPAALCSRNMRFEVISMMTVVRAVAIAGLSITFAYIGFEYMSFAWAQVIGWAITAVCYNAVVWRPDIWKLRFKGSRAILKFGMEMIGTSGVRELSTRAGEMVLGSTLGLAALGLYTRASSLSANVYSYTFGAASSVMFSRLSQDLRDTGAFHQTYLRFMRLMLGALWPLMFGLAILSEPIIYVLYGAKWQASATPLALLSVAYALMVAIGMSSEIFILRHQTGRQVKLEAVRSLAGFVFFAGGSTISLSFAAAGKLVESIIASLLYRRAIPELLDVQAGALIRVYREGLLLGATAILPSLALMLWYDFSPQTPILLVLSSVAAGGVLWAALLWHLRHPITMELKRLLRCERSAGIA